MMAHAKGRVRRKSDPVPWPRAPFLACADIWSSTPVVCLLVRTPHLLPPPSHPLQTSRLLTSSCGDCCFPAVSSKPLPLSSLPEEKWHKLQQRQVTLSLSMIVFKTRLSSNPALAVFLFVCLFTYVHLNSFSNPVSWFFLSIRWG